jgi:hypothetical protein
MDHLSRSAERQGRSLVWAGKDSNLRRLCRLIYSQLPLATRAPTREDREDSARSQAGRK